MGSARVSIGPFEVLLLGAGAARLEPFVRESGDVAQLVEEPLGDDLGRYDPEALVVSYGYRHLLRRHHLAHFRRVPVNLHISLLPWNRGADPNLWSFLEDTPKGVTIHEIDEGLDTGKILVQREIKFPEGVTLRESYGILQGEMEALFRENWAALRIGKVAAKPQPAGGTAHRLKDKGPYETLLTRGWDTPVAELIGKAR